MEYLKGGWKFPSKKVDGKCYKSAASPPAKHKQTIAAFNLHAGDDSEVVLRDEPRWINFQSLIFINSSFRKKIQGDDTITLGASPRSGGFTI